MCVPLRMRNLFHKRININSTRKTKCNKNAKRPKYIFKITNQLRTSNNLSNICISKEIENGEADPKFIGPRIYSACTLAKR